MSVLLVETTLGAFTIALFDRQAPATCRYFREQVRRGALDGGGVFRITTAANLATHPIEVVQLGTSRGLAEERVRIAHESTACTGLRHRRWTASAARMAPGEVYASLFICMRDEPSLDAGGRRHEDGLGFAAFGEVVAGHDVLEAIFRRAEPEELLSDPIRIQSVTLIATSPEVPR